MSKNCVGSLPYGALGKLIHPWQQEKHVSMGFHKTPLWKVFPYTIPRSLVTKIKGNLKMTAFQEMSIESKLLNQIILFCGRCFIQWCKIIQHFYTRNVLKKLKIRRSAFFWDTRYKSYGHPLHRTYYFCIPNIGVGYWIRLGWGWAQSL